MLDADTIRELEILCINAAHHATTFREAVQAQAEAHQIDRAGLSAYIRARVADRLDALERKHEAINQLRLQFDIDPAA